VVLVAAVAVLVGGIATVLLGSRTGGGTGGAPAGWSTPAASRTITDGAATSEAADVAEPAVGAAVPAPGAPTQDLPIGSGQRALVRTAQVVVEVTDPAATGRQVRTAAAAAGGFVAEEQTGPAGSWVVLRVPTGGLDRLVEEIGTFGTVLERSSQVVDATEEVVDLDARVASQQASVARVRALLAQAESIGDVVAVESELARREAELDSLTSRLAALREQVALSTLTVELRTAPVADEDERAAGFGDGLGAGWDGLRALGSALAAAVGFLLPFLPVLAVLAAIAWLARRMLRARRAAPPSSTGA
jgi:hypothetical protein